MGMMTFLNIAFWLALAFDLGAIGLLFVLGLAAAKPSHSNPISVTFLLLIVPVVILIGLALVFLRVNSPVIKIAVFAIAASPLGFVAVGVGMSGVAKLFFPEEANREMSRPYVPPTDIRHAIEQADAATVTAALAAHPPTPDDAGSLFSSALYRIEKEPARIDILKALLAAGLDANGANGEKPVEMAIRRSPKTGPEPIKILLDAGAKPEALNQLGEPVFFAALAKDIDVDILKLLLARGARATTTSYAGVTALAKATAAGNKQAAALLQ
jgi:hypothetical protein